MSLPSKKSLTELFRTYERQRGKVDWVFAWTDEPTSADFARAVREQMEQSRSHENIDRVLDLADKLLPGHGVEAIRGDYHVDGYYYDIVALYVNMGDTYNLTLLYDTDRDKFYVTTMGDWVEANQKRYRIF